LKEGHRSTYRPFSQGGITNRGSSSTAKTTPFPKNATIKPAKSVAKQLDKNEAQAGSNRSILLTQVENALNVMVLGILLMIVQITR
jgi:hypothetical protein